MGLLDLPDLRHTLVDIGTCEDAFFLKIIHFKLTTEYFRSLKASLI